MDFTKGYKAAFYAAFLDPVTWSENLRFEIVSGSISRSNTGLRHSAELSVRSWDETTDRWARIYLDCDQNGERSHEALFTGIISTPSDNQTGATNEVKLRLYSPLKAAKDIKLPVGWYVPKNADGVNMVLSLLKSQPAPVEAEGLHPRLKESIIAEANENCVTMIEKILTAINWRLQIAGDGTVLLSPQPDAPTLTMSANANDIIEVGTITKDHDFFTCPNVLTVIAGDSTYTLKDDEDILERGREIQVIEDSVTLADNESIIQYAVRRLKDLQEKTETIGYTRRYMPDVNISDLVKIDYEDTNGVYEVESQDITLGAGVKTNEKGRRAVNE